MSPGISKCQSSRLCPLCLARLPDHPPPGAMPHAPDPVAAGDSETRIGSITSGQLDLACGPTTSNPRAQKARGVLAGRERRRCGGWRAGRCRGRLPAGSTTRPRTTRRFGRSLH